MGWPRSNNLRTHLQWANENNVFFPKQKSEVPIANVLLDSDTDTTAESDSDSDLEVLALITKPQESSIASSEHMQTPLAHLPSPTSPRKPAGQESSLPSAQDTVNLLDSPIQSPEADNFSPEHFSPGPVDMELSNTYPGDDFPVDEDQVGENQVDNQVEDQVEDQVDEDQVEDYPVHPVVEYPVEDFPVHSQILPPIHSQEAPVTGPKQEIGSLFTEKIALLERKVNLLESALRKHHVECNTADVDRNLKEVEHRIDRFAEDGDDECVVTGIQSSPGQFSPTSPLMRTKRGLPADELYTDAFDSDSEDMQVEDIRRLQSSPAVCQVADRSHDEVHVADQLHLHDTPIYSIDDDVSAVHGGLSSTVSSQVPTMQSYPWSKEVMHTLRTRFGLNGFRPNQAEAVNETLNGKDVVVLMPTGGGKSLCYQLPALVAGGRTVGTTVVISPLISLMQDQVYHLKNRNIQAEMVNSRLGATERNAVFAKLRTGELQLLYLSPEMLSSSVVMKNALLQLHTEKRLARIVIDEAHCVSSWGHDFRPDYMELSHLQKDFPNTPIMALTATANERVLLDIVNCLRPNPKVLRQSFNRQNLFYEVRPKTKNVLQEIAGICRHFPGKSGIIYCNSKKNCEDTAGNLQALGISASFYHAGMDQELRASVQEDWQQGRTQVVCATIAFGMGIDKPDVRYVIHLTLPRNMEGYYQETGRAGRDGKPSWCVLFYTYRDVQMLQRLISQDRELTPAMREHHMSLLIRVMQYCENQTDCRRKQILQYFNEVFDAKQCRMQCDNCRKMCDQSFERRDMTGQARQVVSVLNACSQRGVITTQQLIDVLLGRSSSKVRQYEFNKQNWYGCLRSNGLGTVERLVHSLVSERVIEEYSKYNRSRYPQTYVRLGPKSAPLMQGTMAIQLTMTSENKSRKRAKYK